MNSSSWLRTSRVGPLLTERVLPILEVLIYRTRLNLIRQPLDSHLALWGLLWSMRPRLLPLLGRPELFPKPAASATRNIQLGPVPSEPSPQNRRLPAGVFGAFMAMNVLSAASLCPGDLTLTMLVDSGATHNFVDPLLAPWLQAFMTDYSVLSVPYTIVTAGQHVL